MKIELLLKIAFIFLAVLLVWAGQALAQIDPSASLLLKRSQPEDDRFQLDSSRYTVKPNPVAHRSENLGEVQASPVTPSPQDRSTRPRSSSAAASKAAPATQKSQSPANLSNQNRTATKAQPPEGLAEHVTSALLGGSQQNIFKYRSHLQPNDIRRNIVEVSIAPTYIYNNSSSRFWPRNYYTSGPGLTIGAKVWVSPFFALQTNYLTSLSTSVRDNPEGSAFVPADHQYFDSGLRFRTFFTNHGLSSSVNFGLDYREYQLRVPSDDTERMGIKTYGVRLSVQANVATSERYLWQFGGAMVPTANHRETSTDINVHSGTDVQANIVEVWLGGRFVFNRKNQFYWRFTHRLEQDLFAGQTTADDPILHEPLSGVSVTNGLTTFELGYTWGE